MRKRILCAVLLLCFFCALIPAAASADFANGEVIFAQRYADFDDPRETGIRIGTGGAVPAVSLQNGALHIDVTDDRKAYVLLPDVPGGAAWSDTYIVEFTFRFTEIAEANGYFGFLMNAAGEEPLNRKELILRANGTCDGIGTFGDDLAGAVAAGETVFVTVPVQHGMMYEVRVSCGAFSETLSLPSLTKLGEGRRGFVLRNASAAVESVTVTNGADFEEKIGQYASSSYRPPAGDLVDLPSPSTNDYAFLALALALGAAYAARCVYRRRA
ncbi:MAG: hypothetical protein IJZ08_01475 [Clostridia bacterium]|nr:hypothetical protein [Clostridia bacterium]